MSTASLHSMHTAHSAPVAADSVWSTFEAVTAMKRIKSAVSGLSLYLLPGNHMIVRAGPSSYVSLRTGDNYSKLPKSAVASETVLKHLGLHVLSSPSTLKASEALAYMAATGFSKPKLLRQAKVTTVPQLTPEDFIAACSSITKFLYAAGFRNTASDDASSTDSDSHHTYVPSYEPSLPHFVSPLGNSGSKSSGSRPSITSSIVSGITEAAARVFGRAVPVASPIVHDDDLESVEEEDEDDEEDEEVEDEEEEEAGVAQPAPSHGTYYRTRTGKKYHAKLDCSNAKDALSLTAALAAKLQPCKKCIKQNTASPIAPAAPSNNNSREVYFSTKGTKYHYNMGCARACKPISLSAATAKGLELCKNCEKSHAAGEDYAPEPFEHEEGNVYVSSSGSKYHTYHGCSGASIPISLEQATTDELTLCSNCKKKSDRAAASAPAPADDDDEEVDDIPSYIYSLPRVYTSRSGSKFHTTEGCSRADLPVSINDAVHHNLGLCTNCRKRDEKNGRA